MINKKAKSKLFVNINFQKLNYILSLALGKSTLQILLIAIIPVSCCVCLCYLLYKYMFQVTKILKKITYMDSNISSWMAQVQFLNSLTFVFKVKVLAFFMCEHLAKGER